MSDGPDDTASIHVAVFCGTCRLLHGEGTVLGYVVRERPGRSSGATQPYWVWTPMVRTRQTDRPRSGVGWTLDGSGRRAFHVGPEQTSGGIEKWCRRCPGVFRSRVSHLPGLVSGVRLELDDTIWVGDLYVEMQFTRSSR